MIESSNYSMLAEQRKKQKTGILSSTVKQLTKIREVVYRLFKRGDRTLITDCDFMLKFDGQKSKSTPLKKAKNLLNTRKYNALLLFPIVVFNQFRVFYNFYFLLISLAYIYKPLRIGNWWVNIPPMILFLLLSLIKECKEEIQRYKKDKEINNTECERIRNGKIEKVANKELMQGDIIIVRSGQRIPADMIVLATEEKDNGTLFVKTDQLDGETDWKLRKKISLLGLNSIEDAVNISCQFTQKLKNQTKFIQEFSGIIESQGRSEEVTEENVIWAETSVAAGTAVGYVIFVGKETKSAVNVERPRFKINLFEKETDRFAKILFILQLVIGVGIGLTNGFVENWYIEVLRFVLMLSCMLPISMRVNLDTGKCYYTYSIAQDKDIKMTSVRNPDVCEELGRVTHILTDKTGTLTLNEMRLKKLKTPDKTYSRAKIINMMSSNNGSPEEKEKLKKFLLALTLCHNVTPIQINHDDPIEYKGSSIDEIELVSFAEEAGYTLIKRTDSEMVVKTPTGEKHYSLIKTFPFTPVLKRMSVIVKDSATNEILFICKGAEEVLIEMTDSREFPLLSEAVDSLAMEGLRTLIFAQRELTSRELQEFLSASSISGSTVGSSARRVREAVENLLEVNLKPLGVSGVEDKLQPDVKVTIEQLKQAGIKVWVLTGDKLETALCVGKATGLITRKKHVVRMSATAEVMDCAFPLVEGQESGVDVVIVLNGKTLEDCLLFHREEFLEKTKKAEGVILCRSSPTQKADVVKLLRGHGVRVCAVGDGGNDVAMIRAADVGIGIEGREGQTASLAADLATERFNSILKLLLWHGRNSYIRSTSLTQLVFQRGVIISVILSIDAIYNKGKTSGFLKLWQYFGYTTLFTGFLLLSLVLDTDVSQSSILLFPQFYGSLQREKRFSMNVFARWLALSAYQGAVIYVLCEYFFSENKSVISEAAFFCLIFVELLNIAFEIKSWNIWIFLCLVASAGIFGLCFYTFNRSDLSFMDGTFFAKLLAVIVASLAPNVVYKSLERSIHPPLHVKLDSIP